MIEYITYTVSAAIIITKYFDCITTQKKIGVLAHYGYKVEECDMFLKRISNIQFISATIMLYRRRQY